MMQFIYKEINLNKCLDYVLSVDLIFRVTLKTYYLFYLEYKF